VVHQPGRPPEEALAIYFQSFPVASPERTETSSLRSAKSFSAIYLSKVEQSRFKMLEGEYTVAQDFKDYSEKGIDKVAT
jgi:hypothetical protein